MLAVPELATPGYLEGDKWDQVFLQTEIIRSTYQPVPTIDDNEGFEDLVSSHYNIDKTVENIVSLADYGFIMGILGSDRRFILKDATKDLIFALYYGAVPEIDTFAKFCRILGLFKNINFPTSIILTADVDDNDTCTITDSKGGISKYRLVDDILCEVQVDQVDNVIESFTFQFINW
ncbi:uncharacterized protein LOC126835730 [Adelges cooleyi]|uniref:uncharacterized protein LOC126835730 n=1 Tax=Adelges cooleyi TaxID=133065 RepID=UPI00217FD344|nr:uncharacterized protein LOC126835730 [Adelges cooleyi]